MWITFNVLRSSQMNKAYSVKSEQFISSSALPFHKELQLINYQDLTQNKLFIWLYLSIWKVTRNGKILLIHAKPRILVFQNFRIWLNRGVGSRLGPSSDKLASTLGLGKTQHSGNQAVWNMYTMYLGQLIFRNKLHVYSDLGYRPWPYQDITGQWQCLSISVQQHGSPWFDKSWDS